MENTDVLVIGCGLSGAVVTRELAEQGKKVTIWERRSHIGGNMHDHVDEHGVLVHEYGPHTFHTNDKPLYDYICRFAEWQEYRLTCGAVLDGKCTPTPFNFQTIDDFYPQQAAESLKGKLQGLFPGRETITILEALYHEDAEVRAYAEFLFAKDYGPYTAKQWGIAPSEVDPSILRRVPLRLSDAVGYFDDTFQVMPKKSYSAFFEKLLDHSNISIEFGVEALQRLALAEGGKALLVEGKKLGIPVVYTGALDELFKFAFGALPYRSLRFEWHHEDKGSFQPMPVVAYPQAEGFTRITEYKKLPVQDVQGTTYAVEYPLAYEYGKGAEPYYPVLTEESQRQYAQYQEKAKDIAGLYCCGRLADFKYYNMDQALKSALEISKKIISDWLG
jgi:UDP-galactopyranose mutase